MKRVSRAKFDAFINFRVLTAFLLCAAGCFVAMLSFSQAPTPGPSPASGTLTSANIGPSNAINYADAVGTTVPNLTFFAGNGTCSVPMSCSTFTLTIDPSVGTASGGYDPTKYTIFIEVQWPHPQEDYDTWVCSGSGNCVQANVVAINNSTADPETISLPTSIAPGQYTINLVQTTGEAEPYTGTVYLTPIPTTTGCTGNCTPPRYMNYPAPSGDADAGEPSIGIDWNPNVASLKNTTSPIFTTGTKRLNTGGVAFYKAGQTNWRANFDDCPSPAVNVWEDVSTTFDQQFVLTDAIGFVDHYSSTPLGLAYPPPHTPGRVFSIDLIGGQGDSLGAFSDDDGNSYTPGGNGGPGQGADHETLGAGPYNPNSTPPPPPQAIAYGSPNAVYYCSDNIVAESQCSRSDDGGQTFGPGVPIFQNPAACLGGIQGHVKVAADGTVYAPNSSCSTTGTTGNAVSTDNGLTWTENNVPGSTSTQDPSLGIGQNNVGKPAGNLNGTNTIYLGYVDGNGHAKIAHSGDRGATWSTPIDVGASFGITHAVFPTVVAGDDNRAAFGFLGTGDAITVGSGTCDPYGATLNCGNIWHLYIATTYDGGNSWITIDATPNDPVQTGTVCLQGTLCAGGRNLLDFNDFTVDSEGRGLLGYADGCVNCSNTFQGQSASAHGTIARQSGGRRLFVKFDPVEPAVPAAPQLVSAVTQSPNGAVVTWLEPDNGGSPITGYNIYRGTTSGGESLLTSVSGETNTKYFDPSPPSPNAFYYVKAVNAKGEGSHCGELQLVTGGTPETECKVPGLTKLTDPAGDTNATVILNTTTPAPPGSDILKLQLAQPYQADGIPRLVFTITTDNGQSPQASGEAWYVAMKVPTSADPTGYKAVRMAWKATSPTTPVFESYTPAPNSGGGVDGRFVTAASEKPLESTSSYQSPFNQVVLVVKASDLGLNPGDVISGFVVGTEQSTNATNPGVSPGAAALFDMAPDSLAFTGSYTVDDNQVCRPNEPPVAVLTASPFTGSVPPPLVVHFDGSGSYDPDTAPPADTIVNYHFDFGDGTTADCPGNAACTGTGKVDHTYNSSGEFPARLTVTESRGGLKSTNPAQVVITVNSSQPPIQVTVQTSPAGLSYTVDNTLFNTKQTFTWPSGSSHTIATTSPQNGGTGTRYAWKSWSDSGAISHTVAPTKNTTYTAKFGTQYFLTMNAGTGGSVTPASGWQNSGKVVSITAKPANGEAFSNWTGSGTGSYSGTNNPASITMNAPITETANFVTGPPVSVTVSPTQVPEGMGATYTVSLAQATSQPLAVAFSMSGTAGRNGDYALSVSGNKVTIPAGQSSASVTLTSSQDPDEGNEPRNGETAIMTLKAGPGYSIGSPSSATVTITP
jgi:hypothetical protein